MVILVWKVIALVNVLVLALKHAKAAVKKNVQHLVRMIAQVAVLVAVYIVVLAVVLAVVLDNAEEHALIKLVKKIQPPLAITVIVSAREVVVWMNVIQVVTVMVLVKTVAVLAVQQIQYALMCVERIVK